MNNDAGRILTMRTTDIRTAAVLMTEGFPLQGGEESDRPGIVSFMVMVPDAKQDEARDLVKLCQNGLDLNIHLGTYERNLRSVRKLMHRFKELNENGTNGRTETGRAARRF